jgi:hypothetical protein
MHDITMVISQKKFTYSFSNSDMYTVLLWLAFLVDAFIWPSVMGGYDLRAIYVVVMMGAVLSVMSKYILVPRELVVIMSGLSVWSIFGVLMQHDVIFIVIGQIVGSAVLAWFSYSLLRSIGGLHEAAEVYFKICRAIAIFVILEQVLFLLGGVELVRSIFGVIPARTFDGYLEHGLYRASGLMYEPSQVGLVLAPAICMSLYLHRLRTAMLCLVAVASSFSTLGLVGVVLAFLLSRRSWFVRIFYIIPSLLIILVLSANVEPFQSRVWNLIEIGGLMLSGDNINAEMLREKGGTVATIGANAAISLRGAVDSPIFGMGLGAFRYYYADRIEDVLPGALGTMGFYNPGGSSLILRLLFELGFLGVFIALYVYVRRIYIAVKAKVLLDRWNCAWVLGATCFILLSLLRKDIVVSFYLWFFICAFIIATRRSVRYSSASNININTSY